VEGRTKPNRNDWGVFVSTTEQYGSAELDERYGRSRGSNRKGRWVFGSVAAAFLLVLTAWVVWGGLLAPGASIEATDTGHTVVDDSVVNVDFTLTVDPNTPAKCAVQALDADFAVVGWRIIDVPPSSEHVRALSADVRTTQLAVSGLIYRCWLA
jgi:hypothetical protein